MNQGLGGGAQSGPIVARATSPCPAMNMTSNALLQGHPNHGLVARATRKLWRRLARDCSGALILLPLATLLLNGCGYTWSDNGGGFGASATPPSGNLYRADVHTVAVPVFANQTYYRGIEFNLSKAVINQLEARTPYKVVPKEQADTVLEGRVVFVHVQTINRYAFNALPQEQLYVISVNFTWKDLRTGRILIERHAFQQTAPYYPVLGEDTYVGSQDTIEKLAVAIVEELQAPWGKTTTKP